GVVPHPESAQLAPARRRIPRVGILGLGRQLELPGPDLRRSAARVVESDAGINSRVAPARRQIYHAATKRERRSVRRRLRDRALTLLPVVGIAGVFAGWLLRSAVS